MYLEKLEINGFKSFAHKVSLDFKPGIAAIVGPNGSGKSNVADAMRWVLGEQSIKLLRGKKSEDVIFSGSNKKARLGMAEVSLYLNNDPDKAGIGMSEICITRRVYRSGESEYLINKKKTRLLDISLLLAKAGMAHSSYSIIGQGMIDNFLLASPQDRKEFFEEASGVKPLQIKRHASLNKLERAEENLETAQIQLQEITPRLNSLTRQVKRLERRAEVENKLKEVQEKYYSSIWHEIDNEWQNKNENLKKIVATQSELQNKVNEFQNEMARLTKDSAKSAEFDELQEKYQKVLEEKMKLNEKITTLKIQSAQVVRSEKKNMPHSIGLEVLKVLEVIKEKISQALGSNNLEEVKNIIKAQDELIEKLNKLLKPYASSEVKAPQQNDSEVKNLENRIKEVNEKIESIQKQIKKENEKEKDERSQIWELQQKYSTQQNELNSISSEVSNLRIELARLETRRDDLEQEIREDWGEIEEIKNKPSSKLDENAKRELVTEIGKFKHQLDLIGGIDPEVQKEYEEIKVRHDFLSEQTTDLKKSIDSLEKLILDLDENIKKQFDLSFKVINEEFSKYFKVLFVGGKAKLTLLKNEETLDSKNDETFRLDQTSSDLAQGDSSSNESEESEVEKIKDRLASTAYAGVDIEATPPGKKLKSINMLSGGERAMTSIALLCAILSANPSPFIILDEVDAALDEANSIRYADIIEELSKKSQFIIITHNRATMEKADILYGVTMGDDGVSALLSLKLEAAERFTNR